MNPNRLNIAYAKLIKKNKQQQQQQQQKI